MYTLGVAKAQGPVGPAERRRVADHMHSTMNREHNIRIAAPAESTEEDGVVSYLLISPQLAHAAVGGCAASMSAYQNLTPADAPADTLGGIKTEVDAFTRVDEVEWRMLSNGSIAVSGALEVDADELEVEVAVRGMYDPSSVDVDASVPAVAVERFVVSTGIPGEFTFNKTVKLFGMEEGESLAVRKVSQDAALSFVRPSADRHRELKVSVYAATTQSARECIRETSFDVEYRWKDLKKEEARALGTAVEFHGTLRDRAEAIHAAIKAREIVAGVASRGKRRLARKVVAAE